MSTITQATAFTKIKQPTDHDSRNFGPLVHGYEAQVSTASQTVITLTQFVCDLAQKSQIMVYVDGQLLTEGAANDYVWIAGVNNTSSQLTLAAAIPIGLNIQIYKIGAPRQTIPNVDSISSAINLVRADSDRMAQQYLGNGSFETWQQNTSFAAVASNDYTADMWQYSNSGTMVHTVSRSTNVPSFSNSTYSMLVDCTTADASIAAGDFCLFRYLIEGNILRSFKSKNMVLAFNVYSTKTGTFGVSFRNSAQNRSLVKEYTVNASNTHERKYIRFQHDSSGTWSYDNGIGLILSWALACGTSRQTTPDAWQSGNFISTSNQANACDSATNNFIISDVVLMEDNESLNRQPDQYSWFNGSYVDELLLLQRYFEKTWAIDTAVGTVVQAGSVTTNAASASEVRSGVRFLVRKRVVPTVFTYSTQNGTVNLFAEYNLGNDFVANRTGSVFNVGETGFLPQGASQTVSSHIRFHYTANARL